MRMRELVAGALLMLMALIQTTAGPLKGVDPGCESCPKSETDSRKVPDVRRPVIIPEPSSALVQKDRALAKAYYDTMLILGGSNKCSSFFGGSEASVGVFSNFMAGIRRDYLPPGIGVRMSGDYTNVLNAETQLKYRLFDKASVNADGPFYRRRNQPAGATIFEVGSFPPNSREARVLMLLHELGHLMKGADGNWLLPDDGNSMSTSFMNTRKIESLCGDQIRKLSKQDSSLELARQSSSQRLVSPAAATSSQQ